MIYQITFRNGHLVARKVLRSTWSASRSPRSCGSAPRASGPAPAPPNFAGGSSAWDRIAACESGGNWATNTGNGYYGGLQFNLGTWQAYGGSGLPTRTAARRRSPSPTKVRDASGGYGAWPVLRRPRPDHGDRVALRGGAGD